MVQHKAVEYISEVFGYMLLTEDFEQIQIKDICERACSSRMSFYRHFKNKREIAEYIIGQIEKRYLEDEKKQYIYIQNAPYPIEFHSVEHIVHALNFLRQEAAFMVSLYNSGMEGLLLKAVNRYMLNQASGVDKEKEEYHLIAYSGAFFNSFMEWVLNDYSMDVEELAEIISSYY